MIGEFAARPEAGGLHLMTIVGVVLPIGRGRVYADIGGIPTVLGDPYPLLYD